MNPRFRENITSINEKTSFNVFETSLVDFVLVRKRNLVAGGCGLILNIITFKSPRSCK